MICHYGCGKKARYQFKNGKLCCSSHYLKCSEMRKSRSGENNPFYRKKHTSKVKYILKKKAMEQENYPGRPKLTIEELKKKYPLFIKVEEVRENGNIEVRCKYSKCENSKKNNGWFVPTYSQLYDRIRNIENHTGAGNFLYCSDKCKEECPCFNISTDPITLSKFHRYHREVQKYTYKNVMKHSDKIKNIELRGNINGYNLDHKFSIFDGFKNNIEPKLIGHWKNLQIITQKENRKKWMNSSITKEQIMGFG